jgi:hypothetical protein
MTGPLILPRYLRSLALWDSLLNRHAPPFWGVAPPKMKIGSLGSEPYFRVKPRPKKNGPRPTSQCRTLIDIAVAKIFKKISTHPLFEDMACPFSLKGEDPPQKGNYRSNQVGAGNGIRTRDTKLGKLVLYQLSYARLKISIIMKIRGNVNQNFFCLENL